MSVYSSFSIFTKPLSSFIYSYSVSSHRSCAPESAADKDQRAADEDEEDDHDDLDQAQVLDQEHVGEHALHGEAVTG